MVCCQWRDEGCDSRATAAGGGHKNKATAEKKQQKKSQQNSELRSDFRLS